jgi:hypothetical protein
LPLPNGENFKTPRNLHLDLNPWWWLESSNDIIIGANSLMYESEQDFIKENNLVVQCNGRNVQCVLNFEDNEASDGGTILVPKFHKYLNQWCNENICCRKPLPWFMLDDDDSLLNVAQRIPMRAGTI